MSKQSVQKRQPQRAHCVEADMQPQQAHCAEADMQPQQAHCVEADMQPQQSSCSLQGFQPPQSFHIEKGRVLLHAVLIRMGKDISIALYGGQKPHVGALVLAVPYEAQGTWKASCSTLILTGHREDELSRKMAERIAIKSQSVISLSCGIHIPHIQKEELETVEKLALELEEKILASITKEK